MYAEEILDMFGATFNTLIAVYLDECDMLGPDKAQDAFNARTNAWMDANQGEIDAMHSRDLAKALFASSALLVGCLINTGALYHDIA